MDTRSQAEFGRSRLSRSIRSQQASIIVAMPNLSKSPRDSVEDLAGAAPILLSMAEEKCADAPLLRGTVWPLPSEVGGGQIADAVMAAAVVAVARESPDLCSEVYGYR